MTTRIRVSRLIRADPTSTALLLAGPTAIEMWPGVRRLGRVAGRFLVEAALPPEVADDRAAASVHARRPQRTAASFVTRFSWTGPGLPVTEGRVTLSGSPAGRGRVATEAVLVLEAGALAMSRLDAGDLTRMAEAFLANLGAAAEQRRVAA